MSGAIQADFWTSAASLLCIGFEFDTRVTAITVNLIVIFNIFHWNHWIVKLGNQPLFQTFLVIDLPVTRTRSNKRAVPWLQAEVTFAHISLWILTKALMKIRVIDWRKTVVWVFPLFNPIHHQSGCNFSWHLSNIQYNNFLHSQLTKPETPI